MAIRLFADILKEGMNVEYLYWVGCASEVDINSKNKSLKFINVLEDCGISFGILGKEESCTGDVAKRMGNEYLFQMQAIKNIETFKKYGIRRILTTCPHCYNTIKNEYCKLGGEYEVTFYTDLILELLKKGDIDINRSKIEGKDITIHDPCYMGRGNGNYENIRELIRGLGGRLVELKRSKRLSFCCGGGGGQIFKDSEPGDREINAERVREIGEVGVKKVLVSCSFCDIMLRDSVREKGLEVIDILDVI